MYSTFDWAKHLAFGLGIGLGVGVILCTYYKERTRQEKELKESIEKLVAEVKHLKETLSAVKSASLNFSATKKERKEDRREKRYNDDEEDEEDDEFFDSSQSPDSASQLDQIALGARLQDLSESLKEIDARRDGSDENKQESYNVLLKLSAEFPLNCEVIWRFARAQYDLAMLNGKMGNQDQKILYMKNGVEAGKRSVELDDKNASAHKWYGILIGNFCEFCGNQEKIKLGYEYKKHIEQAIQLNPEDPSAYSLLARWCYEVYMLPWYMRKVAAAIFAEPPTSSIEEALGYAIKAEELRPDFWKENSLLIGKCYYQKSDYGNAKKWLKKAKELPTKSEDDRLAQKEIEELLQKV